ncbi:sigma-54 interaction domain-containing protein [Hydrogenophaga sp. NFH-34]|uniref:sigma-54 interaction domain-containing protein n=1 Tax=Hydrogenophaga sp. NFH-34 TaxID=2744446 RepID=UPI001F1973AF|nr:sigma 54-interacting transcriptional regulator [Hydrogenophaga sp. NFH-34]
MEATLTTTLELLLDGQHQARLVEEQQAIVDHIADGLLVLEPGTVVRHINRTAARLLHISPESAIGRPLSSLVDFQTVVEPVFDSGNGYIDRELIITSPSLHLHLVDTAIPIKDETGKVVSVVNTFREIQRVRTLAQHISGSHARYRFEDIIGQSPALAGAVLSARKAARGATNVLLSGESGVGKEMFAQAIHNASPRHEGAFIAINCAALPRDLIESELFGYASGSFTGARREGRPGKFEAASGGTIFLDEISELPIDVQAKLLRVLQEREVVRVGDTRGIPVDVRIVSASNQNLQHMVLNRAFREDLYYRCNVIEIEIPPLRNRQIDIPLLAYHFLAKYSSLLNKSVYGISAQAMASLQTYSWPGNIRELENSMERAVNLCDHQEVDVTALSLFTPSVSVDETPIQLTDSPPISLEAAERAAIETAVRYTGFNLTQAAKILGISKPSVYAKVKKYGISLERRRSQA